jgi:serine phosphatase RsbU (regulator of sigma subunit)
VALHFSWLSVPFLVMAVSLLVAALLNALIRGNPMLRAAGLAVFAAAFPYPVALAVMASTDDPDLAHRMAKLFVGSISLLGPAMMMLLLGISGRLERYRWLIGVATLCAATTCALTWATDLMVRPVEDMWRTPSGMLFHRANPLDTVHVGQFVFWALLGAWLGRRGPRPAHERQRRQVSRIGAMIAIAVIGAGDALLANGIGVYPFAWIPGLIAIWLVIYAILRHDLLHARGLDRGGAWELGIIVALALAAGITLYLAGDLTLFESALATAPLLAVAQLAIFVVRRRGPGRSAQPSEADRDLDAYAELCARVRREQELIAPLTQLITRHAGLTNPRLLLCEEDGALRPASGGDALVSVDARIRPWLLAAGGAISIDDLPTMRLGGLREPVEAFIVSLQGDLVVPLCARDRLVGMLVTTLPPTGRGPREDQLQLLDHAARSTARALVYTALLREVEARVTVAREVEVARAVQHARAAGELRRTLSGCDIVGWYQPAEQFGGHWWATDVLPDGRFTVVMGDVAGRSVSAALVSFTAEGAYETARRMLGVGFEVISLLETLHASIGSVGGTRHAMSCLASVFDAEERRITFANAGHPFPYLVRRAPGGAELRSLVSRGTPLGGNDLTVSAVTTDLQSGDQVLFHSDSLTEVRGPDGHSYGHRRLQRLLRARAGDPQLIAAVLDDVRAYAGDRKLDDDLSLVMVRVA